MNTTDQTTRRDPETGGVAGPMRKAFRAGLGVAEKMHQFAVEIPLNLVPESVASPEQTTALKDKHRSLLRGMYSSIDAFASKAIDVGGERASRFAEGLREFAEKTADERDREV